MCFHCDNSLKGEGKGVLAYYDVGREGAIYCIGEESIGHTYTQKLCISIPGTIQKEYMNSRYKNRENTYC